MLQHRLGGLGDTITLLASVVVCSPRYVLIVIMDGAQWKVMTVLQHCRGDVGGHDVACQRCGLLTTGVWITAHWATL